MKALLVRLVDEASDKMLVSPSEDDDESSDVFEVKSVNPVLNTGISDSSPSVTSDKPFSPLASTSVVQILLSLDFGESFCPPSPSSVQMRSDSDSPDEALLDSGRLITKRELFLIDVASGNGPRFS